MFLAGAAVMVTTFIGTRIVTENRSDIGTVCTKVNAVVDYVDSLVQRTTANADRPPARVSDPEVQRLIDEGRDASEEFKRFAAEQSNKARCGVQ